ncbi:hypothetical protein [Polyangium jinanense]|uniref:Dickkopf N-terminal cysteine-rich domain-containing protein n=1 Tax=Polyangium jinanense TaxID=2829994 RepID=A0A9X3XDE0_9BACT|nr:hypothetical protein [Polyangium jinanense]MDC3960665.1 hypothetical protein [Polyangium jinanense]MDC3986953.1 hypothetical protein [Polyangium jinanense]
MKIHSRSFPLPRIKTGLAFRLSALFLLAAPLGACGDEPPAGPGPIPLDALRDELAQATCEQHVRCGLSPDKPTCDATQGDEQETLQLLTDAVLGLVTYDPTAGRACVEAVRAYACDTRATSLKSISDACAGMFVGTVREGEACLLAEECAGDSFCDTSMPTGGGVCTLGVCKKRPALVAVGGDCTTNPCVASAYCDQAAMPFTCKARKDNGDACDAVDQCKDGMRCDVGGNPQTCYLLQNRGGQCNPSLQQGACVRFDDYCHPTDRKCVQLPGDGTACTMDNECLQYAFCDNGTCKRKAIEGEACMDDGNCLGTLRCNEMVCTVRVSDEVCAF